MGSRGCRCPARLLPPEPRRGVSAAVLRHREEEIFAAACANKRPRGGNTASRAGENPNLLVQSPRLEERTKSQIKLGFPPSLSCPAPQLVLSGEVMPLARAGAWRRQAVLAVRSLVGRRKRLKLNVELISYFISKQLRVIMSVTV